MFNSDGTTRKESGNKDREGQQESMKEQTGVQLVGEEEEQDIMKRHLEEVIPLIWDPVNPRPLMI